MRSHDYGQGERERVAESETESGDKQFLASPIGNIVFVGGTAVVEECGRRVEGVAAGQNIHRDGGVESPIKNSDEEYPVKKEKKLACEVVEEEELEDEQKKLDEEMEKWRRRVQEWLES
ncbi:hypothetical protein ACFX2I_039140 [Malus domestica]